MGSFYSSQSTKRTSAIKTSVPPLPPGKDYKKLDSNFGINGVIDESNIAYLVSTYKSVLYVATDSPDDVSYPGGFEALTTATNLPAHTIPFDINSTAYQIATLEQPVLGPATALSEFYKYKRALDGLPRPTVIICKSGRRASAVWAAYNAINNKLSVESALADSESQKLTYIGHEGLRKWVTTVVSSASGKNPLCFRQLFEKESSTYTYLLADSVTKEAILIDPVLETVNRDAKLVSELGLELKYVLNTHVHADHVTGSGSLKTLIPGLRSVISEASGAVADVKISEGDTVVFGTRYVVAISTTGHTQGCISYVIDDMSKVFTGDTLLIRGCGRTDFQGGSSQEMYQSIHTKLFKLPSTCEVYPAHDYNGQTCSSIGEESKYNPRLTKSAEEFDAIMKGLNLPYPKKIDASVPANLKCGV